MGIASSRAPCRAGSCSVQHTASSARACGVAPVQCSGRSLRCTRCSHAGRPVCGSNGRGGRAGTGTGTRYMMQRMRARAQVLSSYAILQQQRCSIMERVLVHEGEVVTLSHRQATWLRSFLSGYQYQESSIIL